ncbi:MAG: threonylcarbamoyl-AMP synthase, partial [Clostridiales bacterium]|nr:threonylcarbamoyl-AMP synthase [Clostridiales bacterium]
ETVYGLGADAFNEDGVRKIYEAKGRPSDNPLIVHVHSFPQIEQIAYVTPVARALIDAFMPGALTIVLKKKDVVPDAVTAGLPTVGLRMPSNPVCRAFLRACSHPICAPSANTSTKPSTTTASHVFSDLDGKIPYILDGGECEIGLESTIVDASGDYGECKLLRAGGLPKEEIERVAGKLETVAHSRVALCPGMKYRHYAPEADVYYALQSPSMAIRICRKYDEEKAKGRKAVIFCLSGSMARYDARTVEDMGENCDSYAHRLFACLRRADEQGYQTVLCEGVPSSGVGEAIANRLIKSSGGKSI